MPRIEISIKNVTFNLNARIWSLDHLNVPLRWRVPAAGYFYSSYVLSRYRRLLGDCTGDSAFISAVWNVPVPLPLCIRPLPSSFLVRAPTVPALSVKSYGRWHKLSPIYVCVFYQFNTSSSPSSSSSLCSDPGPLVDLSRDVFYARLITFLFLNSFPP